MTETERQVLLKPTQIEKGQEPNSIRIAWNNGEAYHIPSLELRFYCPCAHCVDEHSGVRTIERDSIPKDIRPKGVQLVGRYAVQFLWSDDHSTGMYHYESLFELCRKYGRKL